MGGSDGLERGLRQLDDSLAALDNPGRAERILCAAAAAAHGLLVEHDTSLGIAHALELLGRATTIERISVYRRETRDGEITFERAFRRTAPGVVTSVMDARGPLSPRALGASEWERSLLDGRTVRAVSSELPEGPLRSRLVENGIVALMLVPIHTTGVWGFIGCYDLQAPYRWERGEECAMVLLASSIGAALERAAFEAERLAAHRMAARNNRLESLALLAGGVGHDLNNLLAVLHLGLAKRAADDPQILQAVERVTELTRQLVLYARGGDAEQSEPCDLADIARGTSQLLRGTLSPEVSLELNEIEPTPAVVGDVARLRQVALNLINNAAEAMAETRGRIWVRTGVVSLSAEDIAHALHAETAVPGPYVYLEVKDEGPGIDAETAARVFDPYFTTKDEGTGFGLATVFGVVRAHGGVVQLTTQVGVGTRIRALFPQRGE